MPVNFSFDANARKLPESYDYGIHTVKGVGAEIGTHDQRIQFAQKIHKTSMSTMEVDRALRTIFTGDDAGLIAYLALKWPKHPDVINELDRLDESREEIDDGLPSKAKMARDVYNIASDKGQPADDRLRAFRLFGEIQGHIGRVGGTNVNIDNRSIILLPRRALKQDDPEREQKVIEAQARLVSDATPPK